MNRGAQRTRSACPNESPIPKELLARSEANAQVSDYARLQVGDLCVCARRYRRVAGVEYSFGRGAANSCDAPAQIRRKQNGNNDLFFFWQKG